MRASLSKPPEGCKRKSSVLSAVDDTSSPLKRSKDENPEMLSAVPEPCDFNGSALQNHTTNTEMLTEDLLIPGRNTVFLNSTEKDIHEVPVATDADVSLDVDKRDDDVSNAPDQTEEMVELEMAVESPVELVPLHPHFFWKNEDNLCWLDSLLVMLVKNRTVREAMSRGENLTHSVVRNFLSTYDKTCAYVKAKEQLCQGKSMKPVLGFCFMT